MMKTFISTLFEMAEKSGADNIILLVVVIAVLSVLGYMIKPYQLYVDSRRQKKKDVTDFASLIKDIDFDTANEKEKHLVEMSIFSVWGKDVEFDKYYALIKRYRIQDIRDYFYYYRYVSVSSDGVITVNEFFKNQIKVYLRIFFVFVMSLVVSFLVMYRAVSGASHEDEITVNIYLWSGYLMFLFSFINLFFIPRYHEAMRFVRQLNN